MNMDQVIEKFCRYSGETLDGENPERDELCRSLCRECLEEIHARGCCWDERGRQALESLAAAQAFYQLALVDGCGEPDYVSSPELKIELGDRAQRARRLWEEKRRACGELLPPEDFYFGQA